jgi:hypothetical protein
VGRPGGNPIGPATVGLLAIGHREANEQPDISL